MWLVPKQAPTVATRAGPAYVLDGDTISIRHERIRLLGLDAPESAQGCDRGGRAWDCGAAATAALQRLVDGKVVRCDVKGQDRYGRHLALCRADGIDLAAEMVRRGMAVIYIGDDYRPEEAEARAARRGLCRGACLHRPLAVGR